MLELVVITGMSGAGRSTASNALEDLGYFVIDNLPAGLISEAVEWDDGRHDRLAFVADTRGGLSFDELEAALDAMAESGLPVRVLFLDAEDAVLVKRFKESRRPHPVEMPTLPESIAAERAALGGLRERADLVVDTGDRSVHDLRSRVQSAFGDAGTARPLRVAVLSFGFKHGISSEADMVLDARFLPNPHWEPALRDLTGLDRPVAEFVAGQPDTAAFVDHIQSLLTFLLPRYEREGRAYFTLGIGCTGGHHRSVAIAEQVGDWLRDQEIPVSVSHRDIER